MSGPWTEVQVPEPVYSFLSLLTAAELGFYHFRDKESGMVTSGSFLLLPVLMSPKPQPEEKVVFVTWVSPRLA